MSLTATAKIVQTSVVNAGQPAHVLFTLTNSDGADSVTITGVVPVVDKAAAGSFPTIPLYPGTVVALDGGDSLSFSWSPAFFAGIQPESSDTDSAAFPVSCVFETDDGARTYSDTVTVRVVPITEPPIAMPQPGQLRFDANRNTYLLALAG